MRMNLQVRPLALDPARLDGLSERLIASHHENDRDSLRCPMDRCSPRGDVTRLARSPGGLRARSRTSRGMLGHPDL